MFTFGLEQVAGHDPLLPFGTAGLLSIASCITRSRRPNTL